MKMQRFAKILSLATLSLLLLSGCETTKNTFNKISWPKWDNDKKTALPLNGGCPQIAVMPDLGNLTQTRGDDVISETVIQSVSTTCELAPTAATVRLNIGFAGRLGPEGVKDAAVEANYSLPYLVAVIDPQGNIISKDVFGISLTYKKGQTEQTYSDLLEQIIPVKNPTDAKSYKIMVGFQLDDQELAYNRAQAAKK